MTNPTSSADDATWDPPAPRDPVAVGDLIDVVLGAVSRGSPSAVLALRSAWRDIAGVRLADKSAPVALEDGLLVVETVDGATASLLRFEADGIKRRAVDICGQAITGIRMRVKRTGR